MAGGHHLSGPNWAIWIIASSAFVMLYFSMYSNIAFMMVGVLDLRRRHYVATKLDELLRTGIYTGSQHVRSISPRSFRSRSLEWLRSIKSQASSRGSSIGTSVSDRSSLTGHGIVIDFYNVQSLQAWFVTRYLMQNFGLGFFKRIKVSNLFTFYSSWIDEIIHLTSSQNVLLISLSHKGVLGNETDCIVMSRGLNSQVRCVYYDSILLKQYLVTVLFHITYSSLCECAVLHYLLCMLLWSFDHPHWLEAFEGYSQRGYLHSVSLVFDVFVFSVLIIRTSV